jgi:cholesterol transport system auxiliary component
LRAATALLLVSLAACGSSGSAPLTFDLTAPATRVRGGVIGQVLVAEPVAVQTLSDQRILVKERSGAVSALGEGQWADSLPRLVQTRLIQTLENTAGIRSVARSNSGIGGDVQLATEIRSFQVEVPNNEAVVEIAAKVVSDRAGRVVTGRVFRASVPVAQVNAAAVAPSLDQALSIVLVDMARWIGGASARVAASDAATNPPASTAAVQ